MFTAILDRSGGSFRVGPYGVQVPAARRYLPGTLVLETTWQTPTGWIIVRDALIMGPWHNVAERSKTHRRSPTDIDAVHCLLRTIKCIYGTVDLSMVCEPVFDYARVGATWNYPTSDYSQVVATAPGQPSLTLTTSLRVGVEGRAAMARSKMSLGDSHFVALTFSELPPPKDQADAEDQMWSTGEYWRQWLSQGTFPDHPWRVFLQSSALALKGLSYAPTGGPAGRRLHHALLPGKSPCGEQELGLPVHLDQGFDVRAVGALHPGLRPGGQRLPSSSSTTSAGTTRTRCRSCTASAASGRSSRRRRSTT